MDVPRLLLIAAAGVAASVVPLAQAQPDDPEALAAEARGAPKPWKPWKHVRGIGRVLDLGKLPVIIDEPGLYAIDRNWRFPQEATAGNPELIRITADQVTLDLHGFTILADIDPPPSTLLVISGGAAEIRNGVLSACCDGAAAVRSTSNPWLHHLSIGSQEAMTFEGNGVTISDSHISANSAIQLAGRSTLVRNTIDCDVSCARLNGDGNVVTNNRLTPFDFGGIIIAGNGNVVADNIVDATDVAQLAEGFDVEGDHNVLRNNTVLVGRNVGTLFLISGTANTLDGNIGAPGVPLMQAGRGIQFTADGNFYGDNRMAAQVPFALGGTVQTDWGGNVGY